MFGLRIAWLISFMSWASLFALVWLSTLGHLNEARNVWFAVIFFVGMAGVSGLVLSADEREKNGRK